MGGNQSYQFDQKLFNSQWQRKQGSSFDGRTTWINKSQPNRQIEEYPVFADTEDQIDLQRELYSLRKDSGQLVAATHLKETVKGGLCSSSAQGRLFLQKIPLKLEALQHIPYPDILHVYFNALTGYKRLKRAVGPFRPGSEQIGFNWQGEAKVWMNMDFSASTPSSKESSEVAMVRSVLQILEDATDSSTTPRQNPSIINYIYRNSNDVTFDQALSSVRQFANLYNGGNIPKNLECLQKVGIDNISKSIRSPRQDSIYVQTQRQSTNFAGVYGQQVGVNQQQRTFQTVSYGQSQSVYQRPQFVQSNLPTYQPVQRPLDQAQQPVQVVQRNVPGIQQPAQIQVGSIVPAIKFNNRPIVQGQPRMLQSQVQTVRPIQIQTINPRPQQQRIIQQIVRTPEGPVQVSPQLQVVREPIVTTSVDQQSSRVSQQQNVYNQVPVVPASPINQQVYNPVSPVRQKQTPIQGNFNKQAQIPAQLPKFSQINKQSQVQILNQLQKQTDRSQFYQASQQNRFSNNVYETEFVSKNRNFIDSKTMNIGFDRANSQELQSYTTSPQKIQTQKGSNLGSSKFNDFSLEDGKSSEALLAELRGFTASKKSIPTYNAYEFTSNTYTSSNNNTNYDFTTETYSSNKYSTEQPQDIFATFNKYAQGNNKWDENIEMKYSMTKNLYDQPATTAVQYEQTSYNIGSNHNEGQFSYNQDLQRFQQQGEYHVDYDPQILADIQKLKQ